MSRGASFIVLLFAAIVCGQTSYFSELPDLPLPSGFTETNTAAGFDGARGRLVVADAVGAEAPAQVRGFYSDSLPALGWSVNPTTDGSFVFVRGRERLTFGLSATAGRTHLHVQLVASAAPSNGD